MSIEFASKVYWEKRFKDPAESEFEWYLPWSQIWPALPIALTPDMALLNVGCGNSPLSLDMYDGGFHNITNIDFSGEVIAQMMYKSVSKKRDMNWVECDVRDMKRAVTDGTIDAVIDKGCYDCVMAGADSQHNISMCMAEVARVLKPGGVFISLSFSDDREKWYAPFKNCHWEGTATVVPLEKPQALSVQMEVEPHYWLYVLKRGTEPLASEPAAE